MNEMRFNDTARASVLAALLTALPGAVQAATFVVNDAGNASDSSAGNGVCRTSGGVCTLRAAIQEANATTAIDTINFAIGTGPQRISLSSSLPTITRPVIIDGWTQPGFVDVPLIEVRGTSSLGDGFKISGGGSTVRGLIINGFGGDGMILTGPGNNIVEGCYVGLNADGSAAVPNQQTGIRIESPNNRIGGLQASQRNVVSGNTGRDIMAGIMLYSQAATGNIIQGNYIGLDATGMMAIGNEGRGITIHDASGNYVGGSQPGAGNLIAGNRATGVRIWGGNSKNNLIQANWLGINKAGEMRVGLWPDPGILSNARGIQMRGNDNWAIENIIMGNSWDGVLFYDGTDKDFDPTSFPSGNVVYKNVIAYNRLNGIGMYDGRRNLLLSNLIWDNGSLGIELGQFDLDGVTPNDMGDGDSGPNDRINFPELLSTRYSGTTTILTGSLNSKPSQSYYIELFANTFCDESGYGEAKYSIGNLSVTTNASGNAAFTYTVPFRIPSGLLLTATTIDAEWNTSELSHCLLVP